MAATLAGIRACVFDAYGTVFDFGSAAESCRDALGDAVGPLTALWRDKQLQYTWLRAAQDRHADFWQVTGDALDFAIEALRIDPGLRERLMSLYLTLSPFPEAPDALRRIRDAGLPSVILSNGTPAMLSAAVEAAGLAPLFDAVISVEEAGAFKPRPSVYRLAVDRLAAPAESIAFVSANGWDIHAAAAFGMRAVWCNRTGAPDDRLPGRPEAVVASLAGVPRLLGLG